MKQKLLNNFRLRAVMFVALMCAAFTGAWADDETVTFSEQGYTNQQAITEYTGTAFSITFDKGTNNNAPKYYSTGTAIRCYGGNSFTVSSKYEITKIELAFGTGDGSNAITTDEDTYDSGTWEGSANEVTFTIGGTSGHRRLAGMTVTYSTGGVTPTEKAESDFELTSTTDLTFDLYDNSDPQVISFETSSTGAVTVAASEYITAVVGDGTITVTPLKKTNGAAEITVNQAADDDYKAGSTTFTVTITDSTPVGDVTEETITFSELGYTNAADIAQVDGKAATLYFAQGTNTSNAPKYYNTGAAARMYNGNTLTIESSKTIESIVFTFDGSNTTLALAANNPGTLSDASNSVRTWNGSATSVEFTTTATNRIKSITITYSDGTDTRESSFVDINTEGITKTNVFDGTNAGSLSATVRTITGAPISGAIVTWSGNNDEVATIDAESGAVTLMAAGEVTFTATYEGNTAYKGNSATYVMTVTNSDPNAPGTENNPYTVAQARAAIDAGAGVTGVYATGIVSEIVTAYSSQYHNISYNISDDGSTTADQLQAFRGKSYNGDNFTSEDDIKVGDVVVVYGDLTKYGSTYEFAANNQLVSLDRPVVTTPTITAEPASLTGFTYEVGNGPSAAQSITIGGANLTDPWSASLDDNSNFEFSFSETDGYSSDSSIGANQSEPNQSVLVYVRLKSGLDVGDYSGAITITSTGAETVTVNLSGSVTAPEAANVTWDLSIASYDEVTDPNIVTWSSTYATMTNITGTSSTSASNYLGGDSNNRTSSRFYNGNNLTITPAAGYNITSIEFEATSTSYATTFQGSDWTNASATASGTTVTVTPVDGTTDVSAVIGGTCGFTSVKVYYEAAAPSAPVWATLPAPEIAVGEDYELYLTQYVTGYPTPNITLTDATADGNDYEFDSTNGYLYFLPSAAGTYDFTFKADNSEGEVEETLSIFVNAPAASIEVSETAISVPSNEVSSSFVEITVTYTNFTNPTGYLQFFDANENPLQENPNSSWINVSTFDNNILYKILEENTSSEPRTAYFKVFAWDDNNNPVYSDLITITQAAPAGETTYYALVAQYGDKYYALTNSVSSGTYAATEVAGVVNGKVIASEADDIAWTIEDKKEHVYIINKAKDKDGYPQYLGHGSNTTLTTATSASENQKWTADTENNTWIYGSRSFIYRETANGFKNYATTNAGQNDYSGFAHAYTFADGYTRDVTAGNWGTICLPYNVAASDYAGVTFYSIAGKRLDMSGAPTSIVLHEVSELTAGVAYIFQANTDAQKLVVAYGDENTDSPVSANNNNGLEGSFTAINEPGTATPGTIDPLEGKYVIYKNQDGNTYVQKCGTGCSIGANRAYIDMEYVPEYTGSTSNVKMLNLADTATGIRSIEGAQNDAVIFNMAGQRVNKTTKGVYIVNGKKTLVK